MEREDKKNRFNKMIVDFKNGKTEVINKKKDNKEVKDVNKTKGSVS